MQRHEILRIAIALAVLAGSARPGFPAPADGDASPPLPAGRPAGAAAEAIEHWIEKLGDRDWTVREEAQRALLDRGGQALEALSAAARSADPEVALRAKLILSRVDPLRIRLRIQRIDLLGEPRLSETVDGEVTEGEEVTLASRREGTERAEYKVRCRSLGEGQVDISVDDVAGSAVRTPLDTASAPAGAVSILKRGEQSTYRQIGFHIERERSPFVVVFRWWPARSAPPPAADAADPAAALGALTRDLLAQAASSDARARPAALEVLGSLKVREAEAAFRSALSDPQLAGAASLGLARLGDPQGIERLEETVSRPLAAAPPPRPRARAQAGRSEEGEIPGSSPRGPGLEGQTSEAHWQNLAMIALVEAGRPKGFECLARRLPDLDPWSLHEVLAELGDRIDRAPPPVRQAILEAASSPEFLSRLSWEDPEVEYFYEALCASGPTPGGAGAAQDRSAAGGFGPQLLRGLSRSLGSGLGGGSGRPRVFARIWQGLGDSPEGVKARREVLDEVLDLAVNPARLSEVASLLCLCFRDAPLPEEAFDRLMGVLGSSLRRTADANVFSSLSLPGSALRELAAGIALSERQLAHTARLLATAAPTPGQPYAQQFLIEIERLTGLQVAAHPGHPGVPAAAAEPVERWAANPAQVSEAHRRLFPPPGASGGEEIEMWEFELLLVDRPPPGAAPAAGADRPAPAGAAAAPGEAAAGERFRILDGRRLVLHAGVPLEVIDRWGNRATYRLDPETTGAVPRFRLNGQTYLEAEVPAYLSTREKELRIVRCETSDVRLGSAYLPVPRNQRLQRIGLARRTRPGGTAPAPGMTVNQTVGLWKGFVAAFEEGTAVRGCDRWFAIVRDLELREAFPALHKELEKDDRTIRGDYLLGVAKWLMDMGDPAGGEHLRKRLADADPRRRMQAANCLAASGDRAAYRTLLKLLRDRNPGTAVYLGLTGLDAFLRTGRPTAEERAEVLDLVLANLHETAFQAQGFMIIAREAGSDFGFAAANRTPATRKQAQDRAVAAARAWWAGQRPAAPPKG